MKQRSILRRQQDQEKRTKATPVLKSVEEVFKNRNMTFEDIHQLNYHQFAKPGRGE